MAKWKMQPSEVKCIEEVENFTKDGNTIEVTTYYRWGSFIVETEDDNVPEIDEGDNIWDTPYKVQLIETTDSVSNDYDSWGCDEETKEWLEEFLEDNSIEDLADEGWESEGTETRILCDIEFERME